MHSWFKLALAPFLLVSTVYAQSSCGSLAKLALPHTRIVSADVVVTGGFLPAGEAPSPADAAIYKHTPEFCRVVLRAAPSSDSDIRIEVWMPSAKWNQKFRGQGNGGFAGEINYSLMALAVSQGYATGGTDTGHAGQSTDASWALDHPQKIIDFGYRAIHEMTAAAKTVIDSYYGKAPSRSYFASCSDGGREALMEAQRFPADYDGILAGAPAYAWTNLVASGMHKVQALLADPASYIPAAKLPAISAAVLASCDAADGVKDGILNDPMSCHFDPDKLLCGGADSDSCLTQAQVKTLKTIYAPTSDSTGKEIYPGSLPGGELGPGGWSTWILGNEPGKSLGVAFGIGYFADMVYDDPRWNYKTFTVDDGLKEAIEKTGAALNATDPNLKAFAGHGGKLILYHGWNDPAISPLGTLDYFDQASTTNSDAQAFMRLFMVPGMQHCYGGPGPSSFGQFGWRPGTGPEDSAHDLYRALEQWVEQGSAPEQVIAARIDIDEKTGPRITMTRPLCAYPKQAKYKGSGDTSDAANFSCVVAR
jgi:feruloyl esterase